MSADSGLQEIELMNQTAYPRALERALEEPFCADPGVPGRREAKVARQRLLCATDLSQRSQRAVDRAALLANGVDAQLLLLHVMKQDQITAQHAREQIAHQLQSSGLSVAHEPAIELRAGAYIQAIAAVVKETHADLIILGSQRRKPSAPLIGTAAGRIAELTGRPVLIVNLDRQEPYGAVLMAAELSDVFTRVAQSAMHLKLLDADSVCIVHGFESPYRGPIYVEGFDAGAAARNMEEWERAASERLLRNLDAAGVDGSRFRLIFQQSRPIRVVQRVVRSIQPDLLIVGTKERTMLSCVMRGSAANDLLRRIECDILVAPIGVHPAGELS